MAHTILYNINTMHCARLIGCQTQCKLKPRYTCGCTRGSTSSHRILQIHTRMRAQCHALCPPLPWPCVPPYTCIPPTLATAKQKDAAQRMMHGLQTDATPPLVAGNAMQCLHSDNAMQCLHSDAAQRMLPGLHRTLHVPSDVSLICEMWLAMQCDASIYLT